MPDQTALEALRELGERASPRPWLHGYRRQGNDIWCQTPEDVLFVNSQGRPANPAYATVAVNSIDAVVEALEKRNAPGKHAKDCEECHDGQGPDDNWNRCDEFYEILRTTQGAADEALDAIRKAALEARKGAEDAGSS